MTAGPAAALPMVALEAVGLRVRLGDAEVLHGIDLALPAGRWTSVVGPNGAGKSTLLKALAGLIPHSGEVALLGVRLELLRGRKRARQIAWLGQNENGTDDLSAHDVVMLGRLPHQPWLGAASAHDHVAVEAAMRQLLPEPRRSREVPTKAERKPRRRPGPA